VAACIEKYHAIIQFSKLVAVLQENAELKRQLASLQQVAEQQKATISLLQQDMVLLTLMLLFTV
jgi:hypothetical protein